MERKYFCEEHGIKAQIAAIGDGRFCLTVYSSFEDGNVIEQSIFNTYKGARIALGKGSLGGMKEITEDAFLAMFSNPAEKFTEDTDDPEDYECVLRSVPKTKTHTFSTSYYGKEYILEIVECYESFTAYEDPCLKYEAWLSRVNHGTKTFLEGVMAADWDNSVEDFAVSIASTLGRDIIDYEAEQTECEYALAMAINAGRL